MCDAHRVTSENVTPAGAGAAPGLTAPEQAVTGQRAELDRLRDLAGTTAVVERAKGAVMALTGGSAAAALETLARGARAERRTLLEECWITLGSLVPPVRGAAPMPETAPSPRPPSAGDPAPTAAPPDAGSAVAGVRVNTSPAPDVVEGGGDRYAVASARLAAALVRIGSARELAACLVERLAPAVGAEAVVLYARTPSGGLVLTGHAGLDATLAAQWHRVPAAAGVAALDALRAGEPQWLEDFERDSERYLLMGDPPGRWRSRAWLPVPPGPTADLCLGVLRRGGGPFPADVRAFLRTVARLCAGRLRAFDTPPARVSEPPSDGAADAVQRTLDALPVAAVLLTPVREASGEVPDFRIDAASPRAADLLGERERGPVGGRLLECVPASAAEPLLRGCLHTLRTGEPYEGELVARPDEPAGGEEPAAYSVRVAALGGGLLLTWERHASSDRGERRLADLQRLGNLGWVTWNLITGEASWSAQVFAIFARDPARGPLALTSLSGLALPDEAPALERAVRALVGEGRSCDVPFRAGTPAGVRHLRLVAEASTGAEGVPVEVHGFVQDLTARRRAELALVESEQAMLDQNDVLLAERTLAGRLQDALLPLPRGPVRLAGLRVEVAYLPAQSGVQVGGDWFSAIELPGGDALFVVGDVAGHGVDAVATMAQLRFTAKGMVVTGSSLTSALARLNTLLLHSRGSHGTATLVLARYEPARRRLVWAQAGHLPPLLLRDGTARYLERPKGVLLGASTTPVYAEAECLLEPGDRLVLYTDGLVERPAEGIDRGLDRLAGAAAAHHADEPRFLEPLLADMLGTSLRDDVCVLDIRVPPDGAPA